MPYGDQNVHNGDRIMEDEYAWLTPEEAANLLILKPGETQDRPI
jgi:hypothetical protein